MTKPVSDSKIKSDTKKHENFPKHFQQGGITLDAHELTRGAGILLAISSLPSPYGIGTLGNEAYRFVDLLVDLKQRYWQVLPVGPTGFGDSPYQAISAFAGNPYLIDLDLLVEDGLLTIEEIRCYNWGTDESKVDYAVLFENRYQILYKAFERFNPDNADYQTFCQENEDWLEDYSMFMAIKLANGNKSWLEWDLEILKKQPVALAKCRKVLYNDIRFWGFCQYEFFKQWSLLRNYAHARGIQLIGDVAFYVGLDSVDVWRHPEFFRLEENGTPAYVSAAVPDKFSQSGQIWGNPLYNWEVMETDGFSWWRKRLQVAGRMFDVVRIDHFLGIVKNYSVPYQAKDTSNGKWFKGPGRKLMDALNKEMGDTIIIADDYGGKVPTPGAKKLLKKSNWLGTKVLMFAFDGDPTNEHLPHNYMDHQTVVYAGTHDNETITGYFRNKNEYELAYLYEYLNIRSIDEIPDALLRAAYQSIADLAIIQMQDILRLGNEARMNEPSTVGVNWRWRLSKEQLDDGRRTWIRNMAAVYHR